MTVEDLRLLIGQNLGLKYLLPLAIKTLESDAYAEGDFRPDGLLGAVLRSDRSSWPNENVLIDRLRKICQKILRDEHSGHLPEDFEIIEGVRKFLK